MALLATAIIALTVIIERVIFVIGERVRRNPKMVNEILQRVENGDYNSAVKTSEGSGDFVARILTYGLRHPDKSASDALLRAAGASSSDTIAAYRSWIP